MIAAGILSYYFFTHAEIHYGYAFAFISFVQGIVATAKYIQIMKES